MRHRREIRVSKVSVFHAKSCRPSFGMAHGLAADFGGLSGNKPVGLEPPCYVAPFDTRDGIAMADELGIFETMYNCRAMRRLKPDPVPEELLLKLIDAANQAPTGSNAQGARWIVVCDSDQRAKLAALNKTAVESYVAPGGNRAAALPHQAADKRQRMLAAVLWQAEHMQDIPALVIACYQFDRPVRHGQAMGGGSIWPAVQNLLLAARALGLGAAPTTLGLANREVAREVLGLPDDMEAFCLIPVGYPMGNFGPVTRLPVRETVRWDRWQ